MKKFIVLILSMLVVTSSIFGANDYKKGYLDGYTACQQGRNNVYQNNESKKTMDKGVWDIFYYLDNYGDVSDDGYIFNTNGKESMKDDFYAVYFMVGKNNANIDIYRLNKPVLYDAYNRYVGEWKLYIKCENIKYEYDMVDTVVKEKFGMGIKTSDFHEFKELLMKEKPLTINLVHVGYSWNYLVRDIDITGFKTAYEELINK